MSTKRENIVHKVRDERLKGGCRMKVHYFINIDKKITICKIMPYTVAYDCNVSNHAILTEDFFDECEDNNIVFTGKAKCIESDSFNVDFGMKLAYDKAMFKLLSCKKRFFKYIISHLQKGIDDINEEIERTDKAYEQVERRFNAKIKEVSK